MKHSSTRVRVNSDARSSSSDETSERQDGRASRWAQHRLDRRLALLRVARKVIHRSGPDLTMEGIAAASGTSKSIFYRYFRDKPGLRRAIGLDVLNEMLREITSTERIVDPRERFAAMIRVYLAMTLSSPNVYRFIMQSDPETESSLNHFARTVARIVVVPMRELVPTASDVEAHAWANGAVGFVRAVSDLWLEQPDAERPDIEIVVDQLTTWLWTGAPALVGADSVGEATINLSPDATRSAASPNSPKGMTS